MRKLSEMLTAALLLSATLTASAAPPGSAAALADVQAQPAASVKATRLADVYSTVQQASGLKEKADGRHTRKAAPMAKAITTAQLTGQYVMTYRSLLSTLGDDGSSASVQAIEGTDSIAIVNFWQEGITVKAKVDPAKGTFTIKPQ